MDPKLKLRWQWKSFSELTSFELYQIIQQREKVFVVEQKISYVDCDNLDQNAFHLMGLIDGELVAYLRAFPAGVKYPQAAAFGRVLTASGHRQLGLGKELIKVGLEKMTLEFGRSEIEISAQTHLESFYQAYAFNRIGKDYIEEGLPHLRMLRKATET